MLQCRRCSSAIMWLGPQASTHTHRCARALWHTLASVHASLRRLLSSSCAHLVFFCSGRKGFSDLRLSVWTLVDTSAVKKKNYKNKNVHPHLAIILLSSSYSPHEPCLRSKIGVIKTNLRVQNYCRNLASGAKWSYEKKIKSARLLPKPCLRSKMEFSKKLKYKTD